MLKKFILRLILLAGFVPAILSAATVDVTQSPYNADNTGSQDAASAIQSALNSGAAKVYFPAGTYRIDSGLTLNGGSVNSNIILEGESRSKTILLATSNFTLIYGGNSTKIKEMTLKQNLTTSTGTAVSLQAFAYSEFKDVTIKGFNKGIYAKQGLWARFSDISLIDNNIGVELTGDGPLWNVSWFNNQISFDDVLCDGGEIGIKASCMGVTFNNVTTQGQLDLGLGNVPTGKGTGIWLEGPANNMLGKIRNNVLINHYAECTERPLYIKNSYETIIIGAFAQGGASTPYPCWLEAENAVIDIVGKVNGMDKFTVSAILTNATLYGNCSAAFNISSTNYITLNTGGVYKRDGRGMAANMNYCISQSGAGSVELDYTFQNYHHYRVNVGGLYDGYLIRYASYKLFRFNSDSLTKIVADPANNSDLSLTLSSGRPVINMTGSMNYSLYITIEDVSAMTGKHTNAGGQIY